jgi:hypothetical protein
MSREESTTGEYPLLHAYPPPGPRQPMHIKGNTAGLRSLLDALIDALGHEGTGICELMCGDAEPYEVQVERIKTDEEWHELPLPYPEQPSGELEPEGPEIEDPIADLYQYYAGELPQKIYEAARSWTEPES